MLQPRSNLIHLNGAENLTNEPEARQHTHRTRDQKYCSANEEHVSEVQHVRDKHLGSLQTTEPKQAVAISVECIAPSCEEGEPPPPVIFSA